MTDGPPERPEWTAPSALVDALALSAARGSAQQARPRLGRRWPEGAIEPTRDKTWLARLSARAEADPATARRDAHAAIAAAAAAGAGSPAWDGAAGIATAEPGRRPPGVNARTTATARPGATTVRGIKLTLAPAAAPAYVVTAASERGARCYLVLPARPGTPAPASHTGDPSVEAPQVRTVDIDTNTAYPLPWSPEALTAVLRDADSAITVGLVRRAADAAVREAREARETGPGESAHAALLVDVAADLCLEYEALAALAFGTAAPAPGEHGEATQLLAALIRFWTGRRGMLVASEAIQRLDRGRTPANPDATALLDDAVASTVSGGTLNEACLDVDRILRTTPAALERYFEIVDAGLGRVPSLDARARRLRRNLLAARGDVHGIRQLTTTLAIVLQGALVVRALPPPIATAYANARLDPDPASALGNGNGNGNGNGTMTLDQQLLIARMR